MKTRGLFRFVPILFVAFKDKLREAARYEKHKDDRNRKAGKYIYGGFRARNLQAIYIPQRKKLKGYQKQQTTFNKRRRAA